jgi:subtilase family serine protease
MFPGKQRSRFAVVITSLAMLAIAVPSLSQMAIARTNAQVLGAEDPAKQINVTFWLNQHNKAQFDEIVRQMYDKNSPNYHHWLTLKQYQARFAPTAEDMAAVKQYLAEHNLQVVLTDKLNHAVTARGAVADIERATGVQLNRAIINGEHRRIASGTAALPGAVGKLVYAVQGLTDSHYQSHVARPIDPDTGKPIAVTPLQSGVTQYFNAYCLRDFTETRTFTLHHPSEYSTYSGTRYGDYIYAQPPHLPPCGYDSPQVQKAYGLMPLYKKGLDGTGQTIVIVDAYGSDTISTDANTFAQINNLPALGSSNFTIYYPTGPTNCGGNTCGWDVETSLDVEWSHTVAPGANIALVLAADNSTTNLDLAILYAIDTGLGPVISNSWGIPEAELITYDPAELTVENNLNETGAALGMSVNFSSGDSGDFLAAYGQITVNMPASSPYATSVGGTSLFLNHNKTIKMQTGWGNNLTRVASYYGYPLIPPEFLGFSGGAGGGASAAWSKPSYQGSLSGNWRLVPDISYVADPFTGGEIVDTESNGQFVAVVGGTSLACPMFSAMWAIATEAAGTWLGQAAPILYSLPSDAITDIVAQNGPNNVTGLTDVSGQPPVTYTDAELVAPLENTTEFMSLMYQGVTTRWYALAFGTDSSLTTGPGWDNVTGLGTPNGENFVSAVAAAK